MIFHRLLSAHKWFRQYLFLWRLLLGFLALISVSFCNSSSVEKNSGEPKILSSVNAGSMPYVVLDSVNKSAIIPTGSIGLLMYHLDNPDEKYLLPDDLKEISGITYYKNDRILCIQDEKARIYVYNVQKKKIVDKFDFGKDSDYEDIAIVGQTVYVMRSDGQIFEVDYFDKSNRTVKEHNTPLTKANDTEGLAYDKISNSLFIACKGSPDLHKFTPKNDYKAIYSFNLLKMRFDKEPAFLVDLKRQESYINAMVYNKYTFWINKRDPIMKNEAIFEPSGLAINPINDDIYLISSVAKILIILDRNGKVLDLHDLDIKMFRQPEGICFSPSGDLYISSEGGGGKGSILRFNLRSRE